MPPKKSNKSKSQQQDEIINFYEQEEVKCFNVKYHNASYNDHNQPIKHPFRMLLVGASGSGKSNVLLNLIKKLDSTFNTIKIFTQNKAEPLYEYLESKNDKTFLEIFEGIDAFNAYDMTKLDEGQHLLIFDDFVIESAKKQQRICEMYIRSRKMCKNGISVCYLSQSFYDTPKVIRKQATQIILKKISGIRDLKMILRDSASQASGEQLQNMYDYCVASADDITNFMLIDKAAPENKRFRKNLSQILNPNDFI
jgi:hypothetical protein